MFSSVSFGWLDSQQDISTELGWRIGSIDLSVDPDRATDLGVFSLSSTL